jgi:hypothetical protein
VPPPEKTDVRQEKTMIQDAEIALILECVVPLVLLVGSILSLKRRLSWHAVCRVVGSGLYLLTYGLLALGLLFLPSGFPASLTVSPDVLFTVLMFGSLTGALLFAIGYLAGTRNGELAEQALPD